jgi:DNA-binding PadR family transcriptional regulator
MINMNHRDHKNLWKDWAKEQFRYGPVFGPFKRERGTLKFAVLMALRSQPLHGYAVIKAIENMFGYPPSPGIIYPTLQMLEDQGYVVMEEHENKKVYSLTDEGRRYLEEHNDAVEQIDTRAQRPRWSSIPEIGFRLREIAQTIISNYRYLDDAKIKRIEAILEDARKQVGEVIFER